jgi:hypothetical protein
MNNKGLICLLVSVLALCLGLQGTPSAWWGKPAFGMIWINFSLILISFMLSALAFFTSLKQIKDQRNNQTLNKITLTGGLILALFTGYILIKLIWIISL